MINRKQLPELRTYARVEKEHPIHVDSNFAPLVVPNGNGSAPCHRWFKYKEAFSSELLGHVLTKLDIDQSSGDPIRLLDPYCGVGTGLLSAQLLGQEINSIGIECHPFSAFTANTKLAWHEMNSDKIRNLASKILSKKMTGKINLPSLSSITTGRCISHHMANQIMLFRHAIEKLPASPEREALILGLASAIIPVSRVRRDGRALRIVEKARIVFRKVLSDQWDMIATDVDCLKKTQPNPGIVDIRFGDGRQPSTAGIENGSIDLILTSPPYPNNIDYNEIYKLELWFLGYANNVEEFHKLRRSTFRSHPSCSHLAGPDDEPDEEFLNLIKEGPFAELMGTVIRRVERIEKKQRCGRMRVLLGYIYDTWHSLRAHLQVLRDGGSAVYVVGNSLHGAADKPYLIPTDLILATLAEMVGFKV